MTITVQYIQVERQPVFMRQLLNIPQQRGQTNVRIICFHLNFIFVVFRNHVEVLVLPIFLKYRVYGYAFDPTFKRTLEAKLIDFIENGHKTVVQIIFRLRFILGILEAHTEKNTGISPVQFGLGLSVSLFTFMYQFIKIQMLVNSGLLLSNLWMPPPLSEQNIPDKWHSLHHHRLHKI